MSVVTVHKRDRAYGRRVGVIAGLTILLHAAAMLVPVPHRPRALPGPRAGPYAGLALIDIVMGSAEAPGASSAAHAAATAVAVPEVRVVPAEAPAVAVPAPSPMSATGAVASAESSSAGAGATNGDGASGGSGSGSESGGSGGSEPVEMALRPRVYVHPRAPAQVISKRKIDDFVLLRARVGPDGQVREVEVLRSIPNCEECTASAVEAAKQSVFEPPVVGGHPAEVWTNPFEVRFSYRH